MKKTGLFLTPFILLGLLVALPSAQAEPVAMDEKELSQFIEQYLMNNPSVLVNALDNAQKYINDENERRQLSLLKSKSKDLFNDKRDFSIGPADAKINVVEFFDYNCGYCKRALPDLKKLIENNDDIRVTFKEMPILGPSSQQAAQIALTAKSDAEYFEIHREILEIRGSISPARLEQIAEKYEINDMASKNKRSSSLILKHLEDTRALAQSLEISGTPAFIINDTILPGAVPYERLQNEIDNIRKMLN